MSRNTLSEPQPDRASYVLVLLEMHSLKGCI